MNTDHGFSRQSRWLTVRVLTLLCALTCGMVSLSTVAFPIPSAAIIRWQLAFEPGELRQYNDPIDEERYWYFTYRVINRTGKDQVWAPSFVLYTDRGEILQSGDRVPTRVHDRIRVLLGNELIETQNEIIGDIQQGLEHAKDGLVIWKAGARSVNELSMFVGGLSGETVRVKHPLTGDDLIMRKTMHRSYLLQGNQQSRTASPLHLVSEQWILR